MMTLGELNQLREQVIMKLCTTNFEEHRCQLFAGQTIENIRCQKHWFSTAGYTTVPILMMINH